MMAADLQALQALSQLGITDLKFDQLARKLIPLKLAELSVEDRLELLENYCESGPQQATPFNHPQHPQQHSTNNFMISMVIDSLLLDQTAYKQLEPLDLVRILNCVTRVQHRATILKWLQAFQTPLQTHGEAGDNNTVHDSFATTTTTKETTTVHNRNSQQFENEVSNSTTSVHEHLCQDQDHGDRPQDPLRSIQDVPGAHLLMIVHLLRTRTTLCQERIPVAAAGKKISRAYKQASKQASTFCALSSLSMVQTALDILMMMTMIINSKNVWRMLVLIRPAIFHRHDKMQAT